MGALWLGRRDSNPRVTESKSVALPLGYSPIIKMGWDIRFELMTSSATNSRPNQLGQSHHNNIKMRAVGASLESHKLHITGALWGTLLSTTKQSTGLFFLLLTPLGRDKQSFVSRPSNAEKTGALWGTRTSGLLLRRQLLYPTELTAQKMERVMGIEPTRPACKAGILPLNYTRIVNAHYYI